FGPALDAGVEAALIAAVLGAVFLVSFLASFFASFLGAAGAVCASGVCAKVAGGQASAIAAAIVKEIVRLQRYVMIKSGFPPSARIMPRGGSEIPHAGSETVKGISEPDDVRPSSLLASANSKFA